MIPILAALLIAAPAPPHRAKPPPVVVGEWRVRWREQEFVFGFGKGGYYEGRGATATETQWVGTWRLVGTEIHIVERCVCSDREMRLTIDAKTLRRLP